MDDNERDDDVAEDVMEEDIVSFTLDPPPATAAAVLQQHHHHHGHHDHHHGSFSEHRDSSEKEPVPLEKAKESSPKENRVINEPNELSNANESINFVEKKDSFSEGPNDRPSNVSSETVPAKNNAHPPKREIVPKKSILSCKKSNMNYTVEGKKLVRNVSFPDDGELITLAVEPLDPWKNVTVTSSIEVIAEYRKACKQMKTKPVESIIKQFQDHPDLACRIATLSCKGVKLDNKACESLEAIFRRIRFEVIDFENCGLEEEGATAILEMMEFYQSACRLNIALNPKIGMRGWQTLCRMLRKTPCLYSLNARRCMLTDQTMPMFGRCLKADPCLKILHLEGVYLSGRHLLILTTALKYNTLLEELYLGDNDLQPADGVSIGAMLGANKTLQLLDLRNNSFRDGGLVHIANGLTDQASLESGGLTSLVLWNLGLTHEGMFGFCNALAKTRTLRSLNLGQNRISDLGIQKIKPGLIRNRSLRKLGLMNTKLANEGAVALAEILADSISLARIDVRENYIQIAGLMALSLAMKVNHTLTRIDLDKELRKEPGLETVQQSVLADIYSFCHRNKQLMRDSFSRENSTSEDGETLQTQEFTEKEIDEDKTEDPPESLDGIKKNPKLVSSLHSLAAKETSKENPGTQNVATSNYRPSKISDLHKNSANAKPRFTITKIMETIGQASADVASKIAGNVRLDSSASSRKAASKRGSFNSPGHPSDIPKNIELKGLHRQSKFEKKNSQDDNGLASPTRARNKELKEFYRKLQGGEQDSSQTSITEDVIAESSNESNLKTNENHIEKPSHIEKLPYPGKAKKLNDFIEHDTDSSENKHDSGESENCETVSTIVEESNQLNTQEVTNGPSNE